MWLPFHFRFVLLFAVSSSVVREMVAEGKVIASSGRCLEFCRDRSSRWDDGDFVVLCGSQEEGKGCGKFCKGHCQASDCEASGGLLCPASSNKDKKEGERADRQWRKDMERNQRDLESALLWTAVWVGAPFALIILSATISYCIHHRRLHRVAEREGGSKGTGAHAQQVKADSVAPLPQP